MPAKVDYSEAAVEQLRELQASIAGGGKARGAAGEASRRGDRGAEKKDAEAGKAARAALAAEDAAVLSWVPPARRSRARLCWIEDRPNLENW